MRDLTRLSPLTADTEREIGGGGAGGGETDSAVGASGTAGEVGGWISRSVAAGESSEDLAR